MMKNVQDSSGLELEPAAGSCEYGNEPSHTILAKNVTLSTRSVSQGICNT
jgi:hypothetical protein